LSNAKLTVRATFYQIKTLQISVMFDPDLELFEVKLAFGLLEMMNNGQ
jgi:hypothetical protein